MTHYETLGVSRDATPEEIKKAYQRKAMIVHPDRPGGNEKLFKEVKEAYEALETSEKRKVYDSTLPPQNLPEVTTERQPDEYQVEIPEDALEVWKEYAEETKSEEIHEETSEDSIFNTKFFVICLLILVLSLLFNGHKKKEILLKEIQLTTQEVSK